MKTEAVTITLEELQQALNEYCFNRGEAQPSIVIIESYGKPRITVELMPSGMVQGTNFQHRAYK